MKDLATWSALWVLTSVFWMTLSKAIGTNLRGSILRSSRSTLSPEGRISLKAGCGFSLVTFHQEVSPGVIAFSVVAESPADDIEIDAEGGINEFDG